MNTVETVITIMPFVTALLCLALIVTMAATFNPKRIFIKTYERVNDHLKERKSGLFDYGRINDFIRANGASYHYGKWIDPLKYIALSILCASLLLFITIRYHWIIAIASSVIGYLIPRLLLISLNKKDNRKMLPQIQTIYNALTVQIKAGVHVTDAMAECYSRLPPGRLREALEEVSADLFVRNSFEESINKFNQKFNNSFIDALCIILLQAQESGKAVELLRDMSEQIKDMHAALLLRKKASLQRTVTFCVLGVVGSFLIITIYAFVVDITKVASSL